MSKITLRILNISYGLRCNLACKGCLSGSDMIRHTGHDTGLENNLQTLDLLSRHIEHVTDVITLLGGEPFLYWPDKIVPLMLKIREYWPMAKINLTTNGLLLHRYREEIIGFFSELGNASISVSMHAARADGHILKSTYEKNLANFFDDDRFCKIHDLHYDIPNRKVDFHLDPWHRPFIAQFSEQDGKIKPWATNDPVGSMKHGCIGDICSMAIDGRLYKCPRLALLPKILEERGQLQDPDWQKYLGTYVDLATATDQDLQRFKQEEGKPIPQCDACPNRHQLGVTLIPRTAQTIVPNFKRSSP